MQTIDDGGAAFPRPFSEDKVGNVDFAQQGMSLRAYFAGQALQGYLAGRNHAPSDSSSESVAVGCVKHADALIAELNKPATTL